MHWDIDYPYIVHRGTGYEVNLNAYPSAPWPDIVAEKRWASPQCVAELRGIIAAIYQVAA